MSKEKFILELNNLTKSYKNKEGEDFVVLNNINLKIKEGDFVSIVGPSGCGKSTLFKTILGSEKPSSGEALMDGELIEKPDRSKGIVFQKYSLFEHKTVIDNVIFGLVCSKFGFISSIYHRIAKSKEIKALVEEGEHYLERVGLLDSAYKFPFELSGGMKQRIAIAQAMIMKPKILLMDEPFGALDVGTREQMQMFLLEQWEETNQTILFITHDLDESLFLSNRLLVLSQYYENAKGSKFVKDIPVNYDLSRSSDIRNSKEFKDLLFEIRHEGLNPEYLQKIQAFDLKHSDAIG